LLLFFGRLLVQRERKEATQNFYFCGFFPFPELTTRNFFRVTTGFPIFLITDSPVISFIGTSFLPYELRPQEACTKIKTFSRLDKHIIN